MVNFSCDIFNPSGDSEIDAGIPATYSADYGVYISDGATYLTIIEIYHRLVGQEGQGTFSSERDLNRELHIANGDKFTSAKTVTVTREGWYRYQVYVRGYDTGGTLFQCQKTFGSVFAHGNVCPVDIQLGLSKITITEGNAIDVFVFHEDNTPVRLRQKRPGNVDLTLFTIPMENQLENGCWRATLGGWVPNFGEWDLKLDDGSGNTSNEVHLSVRSEDDKKECKVYDVPCLLDQYFGKYKTPVVLGVVVLVALKWILD